MIPSNPSPNFATAFSPFSPAGRATVGEESRELKGSPLQAVEAPAQPARAENRRGPDERPAEVEERERLRDPRRESQQQASQEQAAEQRQQEQDRRQIEQLAARDREVRAHEQAHAAVGGQYAGAPQFTFKRGPDGLNYAVAGEVKISTGAVANDPEATIAKAQQIRRAALAPSEPSPQDRRVAAEAVQLELNARAQLQELRREEARIEETRIEEAQLAEELEARKQEEARLEAQRRESTQRDARDAEEAAGRLAEFNNRSIDINRRLIDIGVAAPLNPAGRLFDQIV